MVESDAAHGVTRGDGAVVAVIDSGVWPQGIPTSGGGCCGGRDFVEDDGEPQDGNGHGTHVSGIVAANTGNGVGVSSVAPGARVLPVRVLGDDGGGSAGDVAAGIDWAAASGAHIINLSLGENVPLPASSSEFAAAIDRALDRGVVVVAASGNNGLPVCEQPAAEGRLLCVGAVDRRSMRSFFSSFGRGLGIVAPGGSGVPVGGRGHPLHLFPRRLRGAGGHVAGRAARGRRGRAARGQGPARPGGGEPDRGDRQGRRYAGPGSPVRSRHRERAGGGERPARRRRQRGARGRAAHPAPARPCCAAGCGCAAAPRARAAAAPRRRARGGGSPPAPAGWRRAPRRRSGRASTAAAGAACALPCAAARGCG